ncbi:hypothetical protein LguiB_034396 [Lonicera macranthoides]
MDIHLPQTLDPDSTVSQQTLGEDGSSPNSPPLPPSTQTPHGDDLTNSISTSLPTESNLQNSSNIDNQSNYDETPDTESQQDKGEGNNNPSASSSGMSEEWQLDGDIDTNDKSLVGAGLANLGNTCFLNAILQCFTHTVTLIQGLNSCNHLMPCNSDAFCVLCAFRDHIELSLASTGRIVSPLKLVDNLRCISSSFCRFDQEDAHEFLQCFLDRLESSCNVSKIKDMTMSLSDDNFVKQAFGGRLVSKLRCCNCGHCSDTYEPFIDLSLEIEDVGSLPMALESFTKVEKIEDPDAKFTCEHCKEQVSVEKQLKLEEVPKVAALHLKRFKNDGSFVEKIDKHVEFPLELDLGSYSSGNQNNDVELKYDLYAVVVHIGFSSTSGHYYCFIRAAPDTWYKFDDSKVIRVREAYVLSQEAYILFYAKQGTPWFSSFMETEKPFLYPTISNTSPKSVLENVDQIPRLSPSFANKHSYEANEAINTKDDSCDVHTPVLVGAKRSPDRASHKFYTEKTFSVEINSKRVFSEVQKYADITPRTPPRSPSPDIYDDEPPELEVTVTKPRNHEKIVEKVSCKRELNKDLEEMELKQARKLLKTMPGSRSSRLLAAIGSRSESSVNQKKSRTKLMSPRTVTQPLAAGSYR